MLLYAGLLSIILYVVTDVLFQISGFELNTQAENDLLQNSNLVFQKITADIRQASSIITPQDEALVDQLIIQTPKGIIVYQVSNGILFKNGEKVTSKEVTVNFSPPNYGFKKLSQSVWLSFQIESVIKPLTGFKKSERLQTAVSLR